MPAFVALWPRVSTAPKNLLQTRDALLELVKQEYAHQRRFHKRLWRQPLPQRVRQGWVVEALRFLNVQDRRRSGVRFHCPRNESRFRAGDLLRLSRNTPTRHAHEVTWYGEDDDWVGVVFYQPSRLNAFLQDQRQHSDHVWTLDASYMDLQGLYERAFEQLTQSALGREQVLPILAGLMPPQVDLAAFDQAFGQMNSRPVNETQREAAAMALAAHPYAMIQGPPGTGKTQTLALVAEQLVTGRGQRVLVTALTHRAIHEALNKICTHLSPDQVAKIGVPVYDPDLRARDYRSFQNCPLADSPNGYVIGATPFTLWTRRLEGQTFDTLIVDESSQVTAPLAAMAMLKAARYVFVGDHQQLPPVLSHLGPSTEPEEFLAQSIFARLHNQSSSTLLTTCYRMNEALCQWPSAQFYGGQLQADPGNAQRRLSWPETRPADCPAWQAPAASVVIRLDHGERFTESAEEATLVTELIRDWLAAGHTPEAIGVVIPYRRQANRIRRKLRTLKGLPPAAPRQVTVDTVDRFQGSEREAIILSFTASDPGFIEAQSHFLFQPQRLNVAVTRARSQRVLLVSDSLIETAERLSQNHHEAAAVFLSLLETGPSYPWRA